MPYVLIVDDEAGFRELLTRFLEPYGCELRTATTAEEGLAFATREAPAVAICDLHMPGADGLWLAEQLRSVSRTTAVVLATADATVPPVQSFRPGIVAYIVKPYRSRTVSAAVAEGFRRWANQSGTLLPPFVALMEADVHRPEAPTPGPAAPAPPGKRRWMRPIWTWLGIAAAVLAVAAAFAFAGRQHNSLQALSRVEAASGAIVVTDAAGMTMAQGSGFFVDRTLFVTNHHVVDGGTSAEIHRGKGGRGTRVRGVVAFDRTSDLAVLAVAEPADTVLSLAEALPQIGDNIFVYGAPLGLEGTLSKGIVSARPSSGQTMLQISAPISHGSSGSPVVDEYGTVVGVVTSMAALGQQINFAAPATSVRALLARADGPPRPLIAAARGAGTDLERHQLIGPVREVDLRSVEPMGSGVPRGGHVARLFFDRRGRLVDRQDDPGADIAVQPAAWIDCGQGWPEPSRADAVAIAQCRHAEREYDAVGNVVREVAADGSETRFEYTFDSRGNWLTRAAFLVDSLGTRRELRRDVRQIFYW